MTGESLSRPAASAAVEELGWRYLLGRFLAAAPAASLTDAGVIATLATEAAGPDADRHLAIDLRADRVEFALSTSGHTSSDDARLAGEITRALAAAGRALLPPVTREQRPVQLLEICLDAMDIPAIRPFWQAVLGYSDEAGAGPDVENAALVDPVGQGPSVWFQQMDEPRPQRNRIHFDITVAHDEAEARREAALAAGGVLVSDAAAPAFWIMADVEGNEICICTWQGRDEDVRV